MGVIRVIGLFTSLMGCLISAKGFFEIIDLHEVRDDTGLLWQIIGEDIGWLLMGICISLLGIAIILSQMKTNPQVDLEDADPSSPSLHSGRLTRRYAARKP